MSHDVRGYYEGNTRAFLRPHRGSASTGAIHRALWAPGVDSRDEAMHYIHELMLERLRQADVQVAADLGCGVGASLRYISRRHPGVYRGITISDVQAKLARQTLPEDCPVLVGDLTDPPALDRLLQDVPTRTFDAAWMIESFNHIQESQRFLEAISVRLAPGGILMICDDFLGRQPEGRRERVLLNEFRRGWHMHTLLSSRELSERTARIGLNLQQDQSLDLSGYIRRHGVTPAAVRVTAGIGRLLNRTTPWWDNIRGGDALTRLGGSGVIRYQLLVFRRD